MSLGVCVTPQFLPHPQYMEEMNPLYIRSILYRVSNLDELLDTGKPFIITLNNQCLEVKGDWSGWDTAVFSIFNYLKNMNALDKLLVLGCGNELDLYWKDNQHDVPPEFGADIARRAARIAKNYNKKVSATSVAGPRWQEYLSIMADLCRQEVDYFDIHPYGQKPNYWHEEENWKFGNLEDCIKRATIIAKKPIIVTEYGVKIDDVKGEFEVANFLYAADQTLTDLDVPYKCWFAWHDLVGAPSERDGQAFGLVSETNRKRPAYFAFQDVNEDIVIEPEPNPIDQWRGKVGQGLLDMMVQDNTTPAQRSSTWLPLGVTPSDIEECYGKNGTRYYWLLTEGKGFKQRPD